MNETPDPDVEETTPARRRSFKRARLDYLEKTTSFSYMSTHHSYLFTKHFSEGMKKGWTWGSGDEFNTKLFDLLAGHDFELPLLNREKWLGWPMQMPKKDALKKLKEKYPDIETGILTESQEKKMLKRLDSLVAALGFEVNINGRNELMNRLLEHGRK